MALYYVAEEPALSIIVESVREIISLVYEFVLTLLCGATRSLSIFISL